MSEKQSDYEKCPACGQLYDRRHDALRRHLARAHGWIYKLSRPKDRGRSKLDTYRIEIEALLNDGSTHEFIAKHYTISVDTLRWWLRSRGLVVIEKDFSILI